MLHNRIIIRLLRCATRRSVGLLDGNSGQWRNTNCANVLNMNSMDGHKIELNVIETNATKPNTTELNGTKPIELESFMRFMREINLYTQ